MKQKMLVLQPYLAPYRIDIYNKLSEEYQLMVLYWFLVCPDQNFDQSAMKKRIAYRYAYLKYGFRIRFKVFMFDIFYYLIKFRPDVVVAHEYGFFTLLSLLLKRVLGYKVIINCDDSPDMVQHQSRFKQVLKKFCIDNSDGLILVGEAVKNEYVKNGIAAEKMVVHPIMHNDIYFRNELKKTLPTSNRFIEQYNLAQRRVFLFVGRMVHVKGVDLLLSSFARLQATDKSVFLVIVGNGVDEEKYRKQSQELGLTENVLFTGRCDGDELMGWFNVGQVFVLPSRFEPFGAVVNEALVSGLSVICSSVAGSSTLINEKNGVLLKPEDEEDLHKLLVNCADKMQPLSAGLSGIKESLMPYNFEKMIFVLVNFVNSKLA